jgi:hypothetical protein
MPENPSNANDKHFFDRFPDTRFTAETQADRSRRADVFLDIPQLTNILDDYADASQGCLLLPLFTTAFWYAFPWQEIKNPRGLVVAEIDERTPVCRRIAFGQLYINKDIRIESSPDELQRTLLKFLQKLRDGLTADVLQLVNAATEKKHVFAGPRLGIEHVFAGPRLDIEPTRTSNLVKLTASLFVPENTEAIITPAHDASTSDRIDSLLAARGTRYGEFPGHAGVTQSLKRHLEPYRHKLRDVHIEALEMIFHKIGRILNGDPDYADSWDDIAGYATLVSKDIASRGKAT